MSLTDDITAYLKKINEIIEKKEYSYEEMKKIRNLMIVELVYVKQILKGYRKQEEASIIESNKKIIEDYLTAMEKIKEVDDKKENKLLNNHYYYLLFSYLKYILQNTDVLLKDESKFITAYKYYISSNKRLSSDSNISFITLEVADIFKNLYSIDTYDKKSDFKELKNLIKTLLYEVDNVEYRDRSLSINIESPDLTTIDDEYCLCIGECLCNQKVGFADV